MTDPTDLAYPIVWSGEYYPGLTKRELFAAMAMQGLMARPGMRLSLDHLAMDAVCQADALIAELNLPPCGGEKP